MSGAPKAAPNGGNDTISRVPQWPETTEPVVCSKHRDGKISIQAPLYFDSQCFDVNSWVQGEDRETVTLAGNVLYGFMLRHSGRLEDRDMRCHLARLVAEFSSDDEPDQRRQARSELIALARAFKADFFDTLPVCDGTIPDDQIEGWLERKVALPEPMQCEMEFGDPTDDFSLDAWPEIVTFPFGQHGFLCTRPNEASPLYNIKQRIWLEGRTQMDWVGAPVACRTLAANVIDRFLHLRAVESPLVRSIRKDKHAFYTPFAEDFLATMPRNGGQIPIAVIDRWFDARV